jgi:signal transduction histidine kinase
MEGSNAPRTATPVVLDFVAVAAHDLRGPTAALRTAVQLFGAAPDDASRARLLSLMERQTVRLTRLTDDLFLLAMADAARLEVHPTSIELDTLLRDAAAESGETDFEVHTPAGLRMWADPAHVQRIVANLVRNAFAHGAPPVRITAAADQDQVEIRVSDAGSGVPEEFVPRLFDRFSRAGGASDGAGLGLSIVADLARRNGGLAYYQPPGATFVVRLPQQPPQRPVPDHKRRPATDNEQDKPSRYGIAWYHFIELAAHFGGAVQSFFAATTRNKEVRERGRETMRNLRQHLREGASLPTRHRV